MRRLVAEVARLRLFVCLLAAACLFAFSACTSGSVSSASSRPQASAPNEIDGGFRLNKWALNLTRIDVGRIARSDTDLVIVDADGISAAQLARLKRRPDGGRRVVLGYLNVGEAETFRRYWQPAWNRNRPDWIGRPNRNWPGHFFVEYWSPEWRGITARAVDSIVAKGFDGVFLDSVDKYLVWTDRPQEARRDMLGLIDGIARRGRASNPRFLVVPNNAEDLLTDARYVATIDAVVKESLLYGVPRLGRRNTSEMVAWSVSRLKRAQRAGRPILVIEYLDSPAARSDVVNRIQALGMLVTFGQRDLSRLTSSVAAGANAVTSLRRLE